MAEHKIPLATREKLRLLRLRRKALRGEIKAAIEAERAARALKQKLRVQLREMPTLIAFARDHSIPRSARYWIAEHTTPWCDLGSGAA
jgi:hypothetical protein